MRRIHALPLLALLGLPLDGCGAPPAPEGFVLSVQMDNLRPQAIDALRVTFTPREETPPVLFADIEPVTYEGGAITVDVDTSGVLSMELTGDYVRAHSVETGPDKLRLEIEIWADDDAMRSGPQVRGTVLQMGESIASGAGYLPAWPLPLGGGSQVTVQCLPSATSRCLP